MLIFTNSNLPTFLLSTFFYFSFGAILVAIFFSLKWLLFLNNLE